MEYQLAVSIYNIPFKNFEKLDNILLQSRSKGSIEIRSIRLLLSGIRNLSTIIITNTNPISLLSFIQDRSRIKASFLFEGGKIDIRL